jgi:alpha-glucosidase (family GH31 glycosyl hydrolase)
MLQRMLTETGYDGWMHDFGEYTPRDAVFADGRTGEEIRNLYPTLYQQTGAEACRAAKPDFAFFVRSGYVGSNRWAPAAWPGDQHTDWSWDRGLPGIIPAALSVGICGTNTWGPDIGGFFDAYDGSNAAESTELWIRWCQLGALTPIMRDHLGPKRMTTPGAIDMWSNGQTVDTWRRFARFHNALVPYLYAYAARAHATGEPTMRHLVLRYPDQPEALRQDHQYLLGDELLVAPVVEPGAATRRVWFPPGTWYGFWDDAVFEGPGYRDVPAPIATIPLFARAGSVVPLTTRPVTTLANTAPDDLLSDLEFRVYPGSADDAGQHSFAFHDGSAVRLADEGGVLAVTLGGRVRDRGVVIRFPRGFEVGHAAADGISLEASGDAGAGGWWDESGERAVRFVVGAGASRIAFARR